MVHDQCISKMLACLDLCVKNEILVVFVSIENNLKVTMWEEYTSPEEIVSRSLDQFFNAFDMLISERIASEFFDEFVVVNLLIRVIGDSVDTHIEVLFGLLLSFLHFFRLADLLS